MQKTLEVLNRMVDDNVIERYAIGGAMAAMFYTEPVTTFDLDVFVVLPRLASGLLTLGPLYDYLARLGYLAQGECVDIEGIPVQFLSAYNSLVEEALGKAIKQSYGTIAVPVLAAEYLVAIAIQTGRPKDRIRVGMLVDQAIMDSALLDDILRRHSLEGKAESWLS